MTKCASLISIVSAFFEPDSFVKKTRLKPEKMNKIEQSFKARTKLEFCPAIGSTLQIASSVTHDHTTFGNDKLTTQKKMFGDVWRCSENFSSDLAEVNCQLQLAWLCHVMVWN